MTDCVFCGIVEGSVPSRKVYETGDVLAFEDIKPASKVHIVVIPKEHIGANLADVSDLHSTVLANLQLAAGEIAKKLNLSDFTFRTNTGKAAGQSVWHLHYHLQGGF